MRRKKNNINIEQVNELAIKSFNEKLRENKRDNYLLCSFATKGKDVLSVVIEFEDGSKKEILLNRDSLPHVSVIFSFIFHTVEMVKLVDEKVLNKEMV